MAKDFNYFMGRGIYVNEKDEPISAHLFALGGKKWRNLRNKFTPTFTTSKMKSMFNTVVSSGKTLEEYLNNNVNLQDSVDIKLFLSNYTINIIGSCAFGLDCDSFKAYSPFRDMALRIVTRTTMDNVKFAIAINFPKLAQSIRMTWIPDSIKEFFTKVVVDTIRYREDNNISRNDFLQSLIDIKQKDKGEHSINNVKGDVNTITIDEIVAQSFVFFVAGYETSATTMTWTLFELANNQECQEKVRDEFERVLHKFNGEISYESVTELKYMGQCIEETLRKYPPIPYLTRECVQDYQVPASDIVIERGIRVLIPVKGIHYDEEYYENPDVYDPERFSEENKSNRNQYCFLPFGEGPRLCIGMKFGMLQVKVGLLTVLRNFRISVGDKMQMPVKMTTAFVPQPEGGIWLKLDKVS
nr:cytochrome P450 [Agasicles hygrophila]